ncbi:sialidase family protein [Methylohalobius crimeensis]|uniref:sialidase family protein n=1 Tax=Methylohalobius crimeensis TaxID=244365 RepID=UPI000402CF5C|nr:sialidase family protein [Methylohalobius crimeensis]
MVHGSTLVETGNALAAAWFGGTTEGAPDTGIWLSRHEDGRWSPPVEIATGRLPDGRRMPCWNPVLFQPFGGPLLLFYKVGPSPSDWRGMVRTSDDGGRSWSEAIELPAGILGPVRAKPVAMAGGGLLAGSSTEDAGWTVHVERFKGQWNSADLASADRWQKTGPLNDPDQFGAIQPTVLIHSPQVLQLLCRSRNKTITTVWSHDGGRTWGRMAATPLPNPNSSIDAIRLADGRFLLIYNPIPRRRNRLALALSAHGIDWRPVVTLEDSPGEYSYPAMIQTRDGLVHMTYTWKRERIKHGVMEPAEID